VSGGSPGQPGVIAVGTARASLLGGIVLVDPRDVHLFPLLFDGSGSAEFSLPLPSQEDFAGHVLDLQALALDPSRPHGVAVSNGLEVAVCAP